MAKTVLITDAACESGKMTTRRYLDDGWNVVAGMRRPALHQEFNHMEQVLVVALDVTNREMAEAALWQAKSYFGKIDAVINNADYGDAVADITIGLSQTA